MTLSQRLRAALRAEADPARAPQMQAYMKSAMPFMGISSSQMRAVSKAIFAPLSYSNSTEWQSDALQIWRSAQFREEYYAAIELTAIRQARAYQKCDALPMYREMIIAGGWWDTTDALAPNQLFAILCADRETMSRHLLDWAKDENIWIRRSAILCQMKAKAQMDIALLYACIEPSIDSREFFLRKAIGWVLRHYARTNPDEVRRYVTANDARLSMLSKREALKHIG